MDIYHLQYSPESIVKVGSVDNNSVKHTFDTSERVARGFSVIVSSMFVAVIATLPAAFTFVIIIFVTGSFRMVLRYPCRTTSDHDTSAASMISSKLSIACWFLIFANNWTWPLPVSSQIARTSLTSFAVRTNEIAMKLIPCSGNRTDIVVTFGESWERNFLSIRIFTPLFSDNSVVFNLLN